MPTDRTEQVTDHKAEALKYEQWLLGLSANDDAEPRYAALAVMHSNLAIAEGQERVAKQMERIANRLDSVTGIPASADFGSGQRFIRVKR